MYQPMSNSSKATKKKEGHLSAAPISVSIYIYGVKLDHGANNPGAQPSIAIKVISIERYQIPLHLRFDNFA